MRMGMGNRNWESEVAFGVRMGNGYGNDGRDLHSPLYKGTPIKEISTQGCRYIGVRGVLYIWACPYIAILNIEVAPTRVTLGVPPNGGTST